MTAATLKTLLILATALLCLAGIHSEASAPGSPFWDDRRQRAASSYFHNKVESRDSDDEFGYGEDNGPDTWPSTFPDCGGKYQSPIDIKLNKVNPPPWGVDTAIHFKYYDAQPLELSVANTGHTLRMTGNWSRGELPRFSSFLVSGEYGFSEVHFHWGKNDFEGSEHLVQGLSYSMEMHVVHYKLEYGTFEEAINHKDGLAVIGYLFEAELEKNPDIDRLIKASSQVIEPDSPSVSIPPFSLDKIAPPFTRHYVSYPGSLTTPPCSEIVTWIVNLEPQFVSSGQIAKLRRLISSDGTRMRFNFRPVQPLNGRKITYVN